MFTEPDLPVDWPNGLQAIRVYMYKQYLIIEGLKIRIEELEQSQLSVDVETSQVIPKHTRQPMKTAA